MFKTLSIAIVAAAVALGAVEADAKKFGGGKSVGAQRSAPTQAAAPAATSTPAAAPASAATAAPAAAGAAGAAAAAAKPSLMSRMAGPLAGIAAGIGLGYLFSKMGAGGFLGLLLIVGIAVVALIWFARSASRRGQPATAAAGAGGSNFDAAPQAQSQPMQYAGTGAAGGAAAPVMASGLAGGFGIPAGFDKAGFEDNAKKQFMTLQAANDKGDLDGVRNFVTDELYNEIAKDVISGNKEATQVDDLQAELLGIETERNQYWASVQFSGKMREDGMVMASPFREIWNLVKPVDGSKGWLVAGIQQA